MQYNIIVFNLNIYFTVLVIRMNCLGKDADADEHQEGENGFLHELLFWVNNDIKSK